MNRVTRFATGLVLGTLFSAAALAFAPAPAEALPPRCGIIYVGCNACAMCDGVILGCHPNPAGGC